MAADCRLYKKFAPGSWFNGVRLDECRHLYRTEILSPLDSRVIAAKLVDLAGDGVPGMWCYERPGCHDWPHRAMAAADRHTRPTWLD